MRFVHAGCGVNALSGLKNAHIARKCRPDKRSASGNFAFIITQTGKPGFFILICNNPKKCEVPRRFHIAVAPYLQIPEDINIQFTENLLCVERLSKKKASSSRRWPVICWVKSAVID
ncbi:hypothetical protein ACLB1O_26580 [Escherichia coli]